MGFKTDIEIAQETVMQPITEIAKVAGVDEKYLEQYGKYKAKVDYSILKDKADKPNGKLILVTDDPERENEGDFICAAEFATTENVNFMATHGKGLICMPMSEYYVKKLGLPQMVQQNTDNHETAFTVSIDHVSTTTGISAAERSITAMACVQGSAKPEDFRRPGHMFPLLAKVLREDGQDIRGIYERNDVAIRELEGMAQGKGWYPLPGEAPPAQTTVDIVENGIRYTVDFENGQKTGFFLDQKYNRLAVSRLAKGRTVLDCFTHTGSFALNAARGGAAHVTAVDVSEFAVQCAAENARRNGLDGVMDCMAANVFDLLPQLEKQPRKYDFIILDPPAFTKSRKTVASAMTGYKEINYRAMKLLPRGGYLATCSCSHFATEELFIKMLRSAARDAGVQLRQIEARQQCADHPILWGVEETNYLKFFIFQVI